MNFGGIVRTQEQTSVDLRQRKPVWLLAVFVLLGFSIAVLISLLAGSTPYGVLIAAGAILAAIPLTVLAVQAFPQGWAQIEVLRKNWTWWHSLWFLIWFSMLVFRIRDVGEAKANPLDAYAMTRVLPEAFVSLSLIVRLLLKKPNWLKALFTGIPGLLAIYCLICVASCAWSVNASWTAYKSLEFLADVSLIASIVASATSSDTFQSLMDWTLTFYGLSLLAVWINLPIWPTDAMDGGRLTGVIPVEASNSVGASGAVLSFIAVCRLWPLSGRAKNQAWYIFLFIFGMASMILSKTRNAEADFAVAVALVILFSKRLRKIALIGGAVAGVLFGSALLLFDRLWKTLYDAAMGVALRDQSAGAFDSLSGRTAWWEYGMEQWGHHPMTGMGAYAAGRFAVLNKLGVGAAAMMHNDWIEILIGTSFWGIIPFALALLAAWWLLFRVIRNKAFTIGQRQLALECLGILCMLTLRSFFNDELSWHIPLLYFAILGYAEYMRAHWKKGTEVAPEEKRTWQLGEQFS